MPANVLLDTIKQINDFTILPCGDELFKNGFPSVVFTGPKEQLERLRLTFIEAFGINNDWHYDGGKGVFFTENEGQADTLKALLRSNMEVLVAIEVPEGVEFNTDSISQLGCELIQHSCPIRTYNQVNGTYSVASMNGFKIGSIYLFTTSIDNYTNIRADLIRLEEDLGIFQFQKCWISSLPKVDLISDNFGVIYNYYD
ncbi:MAG: hypothetical protein ACRCXZ_10225 [Patescibacteria group bacterium]